MTEALLSVPFLILAIALAAFLGPSLTNAMVAIGLSAMPRFLRITRGQVLVVKTEDYVQSARAIGLRDGATIVRYILPNVLSPMVVQASLSFPGLGQLPPAPSWGGDAQYREGLRRPGAVDVDFPWAMIFLTVLGLNLIGDGLRDALDPKEQDEKSATSLILRISTGRH